MSECGSWNDLLMVAAFAASTLLICAFGVVLSIAIMAMLDR